VSDEANLADGSLPSSRERLAPLLLALLATVAVVVSIAPFPVGVYQDDGIYTVLAKSLATGEGYRYLHLPGAPNGTHYPPLYPLFLAGLWKVFPSFPANITLFKFANAGFIGLAAFMAWRFARRQVGMGHWAALLSTGAFTICAPVVLHGVMVLSEPMFLAALFPVLMACERAGRSGERRDALVAGAVAGALALIRTVGVVAIPATALVLAWRRRWVPALLVLASGAAIMLPWQLWIGAHDDQLPAVFLGRYGSYSGWLMGGVRDGGIAWVGELVLFNLRLLVEGGWQMLAVEPLPLPVRWLATIVVTAFFAGGWWLMLRRAPVAAWAVAIYLAMIVSWPFEPPRFIFAMWPLVGMIMGLAIHAVVNWQPATRPRLAIRVAAVTMAALLMVGYARYNYLGAESRWWSEVQSFVANRAKPMAEWVIANTPADAVVATDDDVLMHLYTGRLTVPNFTFTPQEHMKPQTPEFATEALRTILNTYDVDYVLTASNIGIHAARGLVQADPPELQIVGVFKYGAVFKSLPKGDMQ
jgi:hypothetical protein